MNHLGRHVDFLVGEHIDPIRIFIHPKKRLIYLATINSSIFQAIIEGYRLAFVIKPKKK